MDLAYSQFNAFDLLILVTVGFSILIGLARGFVREVFGMAAWAGAVLVARRDYQWPKDFFMQWIKAPHLLYAAGFFTVFCLTLIVFLSLAQGLSIMVQKSFAKTVDQSLGLVFGFLRGIGVVCATYMASLFLFSADKIPSVVNHSKSVTWLRRAVILAHPLVPESLKNNEKWIQNLQDLRPPTLSSEGFTQILSSPPPNSR